MFPKIQIPQVKIEDVYSQCSSIVQYIITAHTAYRATVPRPVQELIENHLRSLFERATRSSKMYTLIVEDKALSGSRNRFYDDVLEYIGSSQVRRSGKKMKVTLESSEDKQCRLSIAGDEVIHDVFNGIRIEFQCKKVANADPTKWLGHEFIEILFEEKHREVLINEYFPHLSSTAATLRAANKSIMMYTHSTTTKWEKGDLVHPSTFENLAMDSKRKENFINDLNKFISRRDFYKRVGRSWKRGYLFHGLPGTGKSSLVAAIANYLSFDVYELQLGIIGDNSGLRKLLSCIRNRSILLLEDIDSQGIDLGSSQKGGVATGTSGRLSLACILNSIDGVWTSCGEERLVIFTTNHIEHIDKRLIRPGRIDRKVLMGHCGYEAFKTLADSYLQVKDHPLFPEIEIKLTQGGKITPAEVAEVFTRNFDTDSALNGLIKFLDNPEDEWEDEEASI